MRYVLDVPRTWNERLVARAEQEGVSPRTWLVWLVRDELNRGELEITLGKHDPELEETVA